MLCEILIAILAAIGLAACVRFAMGLLLYPLRGIIILLPAHGDGRELEHKLKALRSLSNEGKLEHEQIYLADMGLDSQGLAVARALLRRYPSVGWCSLSEMEPKEGDCHGPP